MRRKFSKIVNAVSIVLALYSMPARADDAVDKMMAGLAKMPTQQQLDDYQKIGHAFDEKNEKITHEADDLMEKINAAVHSSGFPFAQSHIDAAVVIHKKMRTLYQDYFNQLTGWAKKSNRAPCLHQVERIQAYTFKVSDAWLARVQGLSLATQIDRVSAFSVVQSGGGETFYLEKSDPVKYMVAREIENMNAVCMGSQSEYEPGPK